MNKIEAYKDISNYRHCIEFIDNDNKRYHAEKGDNGFGWDLYIREFCSDSHPHYKDQFQNGYFYNKRIAEMLLLNISEPTPLQIYQAYKKEEKQQKYWDDEDCKPVIGEIDISKYVNQGE